VLIGRALATDPSTLLKVLWVTGCVLVSIPRQTIFEAAPVPVTPFRSLTVVALPLWGTLLLFAAGIAIANRRATYRLSLSARERDAGTRVQIAFTPRPETPYR